MCGGPQRRAPADLSQQQGSLSSWCLDAPSPAGWVRGCQTVEGGIQERRPRWDGTFGQLGPICCHFHGQAWELSGMKLSTDKVPP